MLKSKTLMRGNSLCDDAMNKAAFLRALKVSYEARSALDCVLQSRPHLFGEERRQYFERSGIATNIHYPVKNLQQPALRGGGKIPVKQLVTPKTLSMKSISLPCNPGSTQAKINLLLEAATDIFESMFEPT
jgi:hypothetical protein